MAVKEGYKKTEVGVIPDDWKALSFDNYLDVYAGKGFSKSEYSKHGIKLLRIDNVSYGNIVWDSIAYLPFKYENLYPHLFLEEKDIMLALNRPITNDQLKMARLKAGDLPSILYQRVGKIVIKNRKALNDGYTYYILQVLIKKFVEKTSVGSDQPFISTDKLKKMYIPIPPIPEQKAIATALSDMDGLINSLSKLIEKKKNIKQGAMQELLTGKKRLEGFSGEWAEVKLKDIIIDFVVPMRDKPKSLDGDIPWCRIEDFDGKYLYKSKSGQGVSKDTIISMNLKVFPIGTLLVSCSAYLGRCAIVKNKLTTNQTFIGLVPSEKVLVEYLYYSMVWEEHNLNELSSGTTISYLSREQFENYYITLPAYEEQSAIATILSDMDTEIEKLQAKLDKYKAIKQGMMQELLTGRIRLLEGA